MAGVGPGDLVVDRDGEIFVVHTSGAVLSLRDSRGSPMSEHRLADLRRFVTFPVAKYEVDIPVPGDVDF
jgi:hypothetical protein